MKQFDLNIERVLEDWGVEHALREIIANALDEQALTRTKDVQITKDKQGRWHIRDYGRGLRYEHLTQNENQEKLSRPEIVIGKFGVGLKDALATLHRRRIGVQIASKFGDITIAERNKQGFKTITTLHAMISDPSSRIVGTDITLESVTDAEMDAAKDFFLRFSGDTTIETTLYGAVLKKRATARIYITGLRVAEEDRFLCSYNITNVNAAIRKALNRERTNVGRGAYTDRVKAILLACKTQDVAQLLVDDLQHYEEGTMHDELTWTDVQVHACKLLNTKGNIIFLTPAELITAAAMVNHARKEGHRVVTIPESVRNKLRHQNDHDGNPVRDLTAYARAWNENFTFDFVDEHDLNETEQAVFAYTSVIFAQIGGRPPKIREVRISRTMRADPRKHREASGLWDEKSGLIIIKSDQLASLQAYASTLLHEIAHATSGASDITEEFEDALTELLGTIVTNTRNT